MDKRRKEREEKLNVELEKRGNEREEKWVVCYRQFMNKEKNFMR
jgi:hypothetical protein